MRDSFIKPSIFPFTFLAVIGSLGAQPVKKNILFIAVDDLRTELGCYGIDQIKTPNIDRLARQGVVFNRAYCQQAVSSPTRTSLLTGLRPDVTKIYDLETHFRTTIPDVITLPQYFKSQGYYTTSFGKIYHAGLDDPLSWSEKLKVPGYSMYALPANKELVASKKKAQAGKTSANAVAQYNALLGPAYECADVPDNIYGDGVITDCAVALLKEKRMKESPFFLAVGFFKPHLPFVAPKKYWDLYDGDKIDMAKNPFPPENVPKIALTEWTELRAYEDIPQLGPLTEGQARKLKQGYYACVSYTDAQIGRLLDELDRQGLTNNTIIILWGDHGWKLGEHGMWSKHTNFEDDTHAPLICSFPGQKTKGSHANGLVEFVDIYPSLCELAGLPLPSHLQGKSFVPLLESPNLPGKEAAFSQFPRGKKIMGYSMRTDRYRYTEWVDTNKKVTAHELYDHQIDPLENKNVADVSENAGLVKELAGKLGKYMR
jgi:iduronate 2-sulfatase